MEEVWGAGKAGPGWSLEAQGRWERRRWRVEKGRRAKGNREQELKRVKETGMEFAGGEKKRKEEV